MQVILCRQGCAKHFHWHNKWTDNNYYQLDPSKLLFKNVVLTRTATKFASLTLQCTCSHVFKSYTLYTSFQNIYIIYFLYIIYSLYSIAGLWFTKFSIFSYVLERINCYCSIFYQVLFLCWRRGLLHKRDNGGQESHFSPYMCYR